MRPQTVSANTVSGRSAKMDDLRSRVEELNSSGHDCLIFSQWTNPHYGIARLAAELQAFDPLSYTGQLSTHQRLEILDQFRTQTTPSLLLLSLKAGGVGLNLAKASYVFHFDRWWNPAVEQQASDRVHRLGQTQPVTIYNYLCQDTVEERIAAILEGKRTLFQDLVDGVSVSVAQLLTPAELFGLFGLPAPSSLRTGVD